MQSCDDSTRVVNLLQFHITQTVCGVNEAENKEYFREVKRELIEQTLSTQNRSCVEKRTLYFWYDVD